MNIIFIILDGLRHDVVNRLYLNKKLKGGLKFLMDNGIVCEDNYANGNPTMLSFPSIFTSTYPLDFGGYDKGILLRPKSFVEILRENDYECTGMSCNPPSASIFGYNRGFNNYYHGWDINPFIHNLYNELYKNYYLDAMFRKLISFSEAEQLRKDYINFTLPFIEDELLARMTNKVPEAIYPWSYKKEELQSFLSEIQQLKQLMKNKNFDHINFTFPMIHTKYSGYQSHWVEPLLIEVIGKYIINKAIKLFKIHYNNRKSWGWAFSDQVFSFFLNNYPLKVDKKQFHFLDIMDVHDSIFSNLKYQFNFRTYLSSYKYKDKRNYYYEESIKWIDNKLQHYLYELFKQKEGREATIVLLGDHGSQFGYPNRGIDNRHMFDWIYHDTLNSSLIFYSHKLKPAKYTKQCSLLDVAPSLLDFLGIKSHESFKGKSIFQQGEPEIILSENCGSGPCHLKTKPIYLSIKKPPFKLIYKEFFLYEDNSLNNMELYKLDDIYETNNLIDNSLYKEVIKEFSKIALDRIKEIRNN